jgi:hypothetical protein
VQNVSDEVPLKVVQLPHIDSYFLFEKRVTSAMETYMLTDPEAEDVQRAGALLHRLAGMLFVACEKMEIEQREAGR